MKQSSDFTPAERRILDVLQDGMRHKRDEVFEALKNGDTQMDRTALHNHMQRIRQKLRPKGQDIVCEMYQQGLYYRHVRLLLSLNSPRSE